MPLVVRAPALGRRGESTVSFKGIACPLASYILRTQHKQKKINK